MDSSSSVIFPTNEMHIIFHELIHATSYLTADDNSDTASFYG